VRGPAVEDWLKMRVYASCLDVAVDRCRVEIPRTGAQLRRNAASGISNQQLCREVGISSR
jgi:hypothetical protein